MPSAIFPYVFIFQARPREGGAPPSRIWGEDTPRGQRTERVIKKRKIEGAVRLARGFRRQQIEQGRLHVWSDRAEPIKEVPARFARV